MTAQAFWDWHAPKYAKKPIADVTAYEEKLRCVTALLRPTDRVLEVGCGTGCTARKIALVVADVTATDLSAEMIRIARSRSRGDAAGTPEFLLAEAAQDIPDQPFEVICAFSLLHLVDDIPTVLDAAFNQMKPGGHFISKTVCLKDAPRWMRAMFRVPMAVRIAPNVIILSRVELTRHLIRTGFEIEQTRYFGKNRLSPFIVARKPAWGSPAPFSERLKHELYQPSRMGVPCPRVPLLFHSGSRRAGPASGTSRRSGDHPAEPPCGD